MTHDPYGYWRGRTKLKVWQLASMMAGIDPRDLPDIMCSSDSDDVYGEPADFSHEEHIILDAVNRGEIRCKRVMLSQQNSSMELPMSEIVAWLRSSKRHQILADQLDPMGRAQEKETPSSQVSQTPIQSCTPPQPSGKKYSKAVMVDTFKSEWPTIDTDLSNASRNGLGGAARTGERGWDPDKALDWAKRNGKTVKAKEKQPSIGDICRSFGP